MYSKLVIYSTWFIRKRSGQGVFIICLTICSMKQSFLWINGNIAKVTFLQSAVYFYNLAGRKIAECIPSWLPCFPYSVVEIGRKLAEQFFNLSSSNISTQKILRLEISHFGIWAKICSGTQFVLNILSFILTRSG